MPYRLTVVNIDETIEQLVFAPSKKQALKLADNLALGRRIIRKHAKEIY